MPRRPSGSEAQPPSTPRRTGAIVGIVALAALMLFAGFFALVHPGTLESADPSAPIQYSHDPDDDQQIPNPHLVTASFRSADGQGLSVVLLFRLAGEDGFTSIRMQRIGSGDVYAAELPALGEGERLFYYLQARAAGGATINVPENAPGAPLLTVRWEDHVNLAVLSTHITLMIGALFFLIHALHYALLVLLRHGSAQPTLGLARKVQHGIAWGWLAFVVGGIPLGIYVSGTALGWHNAWGAWPLGADITDTKTELLALYWGAVLLLRSERLASLPRISDRALARLVLIGAALTTIVYAIPHSYFFQ